MIAPHTVTMENHLPFSLITPLVQLKPGLHSQRSGDFSVAAGLQKSEIMPILPAFERHVISTPFKVNLNLKKKNLGVWITQRHKDLFKYLFKYYIQFFPIVLTKSFVHNLDNLLSSFIRNKKRPGIRKMTLQLPQSTGGLSLPARSTLNVSQDRLQAEGSVKENLLQNFFFHGTFLVKQTSWFLSLFLVALRIFVLLQGKDLAVFLIMLFTSFHSVV